MGRGVDQEECDGSFNCLVGATDLGTGSDTVLGQMAAEVLACIGRHHHVFQATTTSPHCTKGAYASSTTYIPAQPVVSCG